MGNRKTPHKLINPHKKRCQCGVDFIGRGRQKYCSIKCKEKYSVLSRKKNRMEFRKEHPELCSQCGCDNSKSEYRQCLQCRIRHRILYNKRKLNKMEVTKWD